MKRDGDGLSRDDLQLAINNYISQKDNFVLCVKGNWGVGKTFIIKDILSKSGLEYYYGSLFGTASLAQLKSNLLANHTAATKKIGDDKNTATIIKEKYDLLKKHISKHSTKLAKIPGVSSYLELSTDLIFSFVKDGIICIDDLERRSDNLKFDEVLGFVANLVQEQNCKVILIFNEEHLLKDQKAKAILSDYREKVFDFEFTLSPSPQDNIKLVFKENDQEYSNILESLKIAGVNNIRIIKKIRWIVLKLSKHIENWEIGLKRQIIKNAVTIALAKFDTHCPIKIEFLLDRNDFSKVFDQISKENSNNDIQDEKESNTLLSQIGYSPLPTDECILQLIDTYNFDKEKFGSYGEQLNSNEKRIRLREKLDSLWELVRNSFGSTEEALKIGFQEFLKTNDLTLLNYQEFLSIEKLMKILNYNISSYKKDYIKNNLNNLKKSNFNQFMEFASEFPDLQKLIEEKSKIFHSRKTITEVLLNIFDKSSWSADDMEFLNSRSKSDFITWLQEEHADLVSLVQTGLNIPEVFSETLKSAIVDLANRSELNKTRALTLYNIKIS